MCVALYLSVRFIFVSVFSLVLLDSIVCVLLYNSLQVISFVGRFWIWPSVVFVSDLVRVAYVGSCRIFGEGKMSWQTYVDDHLMCEIGRYQWPLLVRVCESWDNIMMEVMYLWEFCIQISKSIDVWSHVESSHLWLRFSEETWPLC